MWLINSSIGRKVVMSVTGIALILFLTFHCCMNLVALFSGEAYNTICELLGANWYAIVATLGLAALAGIHIVYAFILTAQNRKARGENRYEVSTTVNKNGLLDVAEGWASGNMLVLGIIILLGLLMHLKHFWYNMMFAEIVGMVPMHSPSDGFAWIQETFANPVFAVLYLVWFAAIWFHLAHGFWSAMHTLGASGKIWQKRMQCIGLIYVSLLMLGYTLVVLGFAFKCAPSLCQEQCCKAQTECAMNYEQAGGDCDKKCCDYKGCSCGEECQTASCECGASKACKCNPCECGDCKCAGNEGCKCNPCKCGDCKCAGGEGSKC